MFSSTLNQHTSVKSQRNGGAMVPRVVAAIDALAEEPRPAGVKKLVGSEHTYRIRVADYRVVYSIEDRLLVVLVERIRRRGEVYR